MQKMRYVVALGIPLLALLSFTLVTAWTGPTAAPPGNNVAAPINVGSVDQVKNGGLGVNALAVFGNSLFGGSTGSNAYLNFGPTSGTNGYGFRDKDGTMQFKNLGETGGDNGWKSLQDIIFTLCGGGACGGGGSGFGGMYSNAWPIAQGCANSSGGQLLFGNPYTGGASCPAGYNVQNVFVSQNPNATYSCLWLCYAGSASGGGGGGKSYGGTFEVAHTIAQGCQISGAGGVGDFPNPITGGYSCPAGYTKYLMTQQDQANGLRTCLWGCY